MHLYTYSYHFYKTHKIFKNHCLFFRLCPFRIKMNKNRLRHTQPVCINIDELSIEFCLLFVIGILSVGLLLLGQKVEADGAAGIHIVLRVEVILQHAEHAVFLLADIALKPRSKHLADAVMVAD